MRRSRCWWFSRGVGSVACVSHSKTGFADPSESMKEEEAPATATPDLTFPITPEHPGELYESFSVKIVHRFQSQRSRQGLGLSHLSTQHCRKSQRETTSRPPITERHPQFRCPGAGALNRAEPRTQSASQWSDCSNGNSKRG